MDRDKKGWLIVFSRCANMRNLETCINENFGQLSECEVKYFNAAADHRRAELTMGRMYDRVPASVRKRMRQTLSK
ncbi:Hha/YmoA family nucleoid-associated regulatory protein [Enterobacter asburiae]|uniref:Hha/YmoA family nucleoid-associated regulatory protein n=1 Tax=Enterobacter asburiae TaxID=61645 RepID=UPI003F4382F4